MWDANDDDTCERHVVLPPDLTEEQKKILKAHYDAPHGQKRDLGKLKLKVLLYFYHDCIHLFERLNVFQNICSIYLSCFSVVFFKPILTRNLNCVSANNGTRAHNAKRQRIYIAL